MRRHLRAFCSSQRHGGDEYEEEVSRIELADVGCILAGDVETLRPAEKDRLELAKCRRVDDQVAAGRGKKPVNTPRIAVSWGSSGRFSPTVVGCRSGWPSVAPTRTIKNFSSRRSTVLPCVVPHEQAARSTSASIKDTTATRFAPASSGVVIASISSRVGKNRARSGNVASEPDAGWSNESPHGSTATAAFWCDGKRRSNTTKPCCISFSLTSCGGILEVLA